MDPVTHFEIPAKDPVRLGEFYKKTFGWKVVGVPDMPYWMAYTTQTDEKGQTPLEPGAINGGIAPAQQPGEKPTVVISVKDIDQALTKVQAAGGKVVMEKTEIPDMGLYARFQDPDGNVLGVWQGLA